MLVRDELEDMDEEGAVDVVVAPLDEGVVCSDVPPEEVVVGVSAATGILDKPAETVEVAVAAFPPAASVQAKITAGTPSGPSK